MTSFDAERAFYIAEFSGHGIVVALNGSDLVGAEGPAAANSIGRAAKTLASGGSRLMVVASTGEPDSRDEVSAAVDALAASLPGSAAPLAMPAAGPTTDWLADLWLAASDSPALVVAVGGGPDAQPVTVVAADLAASVRALKLVITDPAGGWGRPPRSFADLSTHSEAMSEQLASRGGGAVVAAVNPALASGVTTVNLCRADDVDSELFTFDGTGTLFTSGGYVELADLRLDDLPAVEDLVAQGVADGLLRQRDRHEVARLAVTGIGAKVVGSGHLAGIVGLEVEGYRGQGLGEVSCLYTVSRFSGSGAGGLLIDGLMEVATQDGLVAVFAVTVSEQAADFFLRKGFHEVQQDALPDEKWQGYDPARREQARAFWRDLHEDERF